MASAYVICGIGRLLFDRHFYVAERLVVRSKAMVFLIENADIGAYWNRTEMLMKEKPHGSSLLLESMMIECRRHNGGQTTETTGGPDRLICAFVDYPPYLYSTQTNRTAIY